MHSFPFLPDPRPMHTLILFAALAAIAAVSVAIAPRVRAPDGFFRGLDESGAAPSLLTLVFSQVTTWIFARSLLTAAVLAYAYGLAGALAYTAYYLSFFTGAAIVDAVRFRHGCESIQAFLAQKFGRSGTLAYNILVAVRLLSEVFANLIVVGLVFGTEGTATYFAAILALTAVILGYSLFGGLRASLRTDVFQMGAFLVVLAVIVWQLSGDPGWSLALIADSAPAASSPGWVLLTVAFLQIVSYPMHDPVMMDRGFLADRRRTALSFIYAGLLSMACIFAFALLGLFAATGAEQGEPLLDALSRLIGPGAMLFVNLALIVSAASTLDSTLSSAAKLAVVDAGLARPTLANGRIAMVAFMAGGLAFLFARTSELYTAVAVSGTASLFLAPVIVVSLWGGRDVAVWAFHVAVAAALAGAVLYFVEAGGTVSVIEPVLGVTHKYEKLLAICVAVLAIGFCAFALALRPARAGRPAA